MIVTEQHNEQQQNKFPKKGLLLFEKKFCDRICLITLCIVSVDKMILWNDKDNEEKNKRGGILTNRALEKTADRKEGRRTIEHKKLLLIEN